MQTPNRRNSVQLSKTNACAPRSLWLLRSSYTISELSHRSPIQTRLSNLRAPSKWVFRLPCRARLLRAISYSRSLRSLDSADFCRTNICGKLWLHRPFKRVRLYLWSQAITRITVKRTKNSKYGGCCYLGEHLTVHKSKLAKRKRINEHIKSH